MMSLLASQNNVLFVMLACKTFETRVGHVRRFVHVAPKSTNLGPTSTWIPNFVNFNLGNHLRLGLEVL